VPKVPTGTSPKSPLQTSPASTGQNCQESTASDFEAPSVGAHTRRNRPVGPVPFVPSRIGQSEAPLSAIPNLRRICRPVSRFPLCPSFPCCCFTKPENREKTEEGISRIRSELSRHPTVRGFGLCGRNRTGPPGGGPQPFTREKSIQLEESIQLLQERRMGIYWWWPEGQNGRAT
jgi:hypothetical protein